MGKFIRNIVVGILVLIISSAIVFLHIRDKKTQEDILRASLSVFGDKLLAMVPSGADKDAVQEKYQEFVEKADKNEVPPEKIEMVAAEILNASNSEKSVSAEDARALLDFAMEPITESKEVAVSSRISEKQDESEKFEDEEVPRTPTREELVSLGFRLQELHELSKDLEEIAAHDSMQMAFFSVDVDSSMRIIMNQEVQFRMHEKRLEHLQKKLEALEHKRLIKWSNDVGREVREMYPILVKTKDIPRPPFPVMHKKMFLKSIQSLDSLGIQRVDSLSEIISKSLEEAGLIEDEEQKRE